ncbi:response regulator [Candidatus Gracilibacteria bacterium]|nr:response regulator [Candidatus Gracilibacteria bacterium]
MNILIIEDDLLLGHNIKKVFDKNIITNNIKIINSYKGFIHELELVEAYDIIVIDIILEYCEDKTGIDLINIIRKKSNKIPILVISGFSGFDWMQKAFEVGASDYMIKPFRLREFEIRLLRWFKIYLHSLNFTPEDRLYYKEISYSIKENEFYFGDKKITLTKKSKYVLLIFLSQPETLIKEDFLANKIWCDNDDFKDRNIRIIILRLKDSLRKFGIAERIENIRGEGYLMRSNF